MQIVNIPLGAEGSVSMSFSAGKISIVAGENTPGLQGSLTLTIPLTYFVDALVHQLGNTPAEEAIAGFIDSVLNTIP